MSFTIQGSLLTEYTTLTTNAATTVFTADSSTLIAAIEAVDNAGGGPTVTLVTNDGTNSFHLRRVAATPYIHETPFVLPQGWTIKATSSSASGLIDIAVTYQPAVAAARSR